MIIRFPLSTNMNAEMALNSALQDNLQDVLIVGYDVDGDFIVRSSRLSKQDGLWLSEKLKDWVMK